MPSIKFELYGLDFFKDKAFNVAIGRALESSYSPELYNFLMIMDNLHKVQDSGNPSDKKLKGELKKGLKEVYEQYIEESARYQINISHELRNKIKKKIKIEENINNLTLEDFSQAIEEVEKLIRDDRNLLQGFKQQLGSKCRDLDEEFGDRISKAGIFDRVFRGIPSEKDLENLEKRIGDASVADLGKLFKEVEAIKKALTSKPWYAGIMTGFQKLFQKSPSEPPIPEAAPASPETPKELSEERAGTPSMLSQRLESVGARLEGQRRTATDVTPPVPAPSSFSSSGSTGARPATKGMPAIPPIVSPPSTVPAPSGGPLVEPSPKPAPSSPSNESVGSRPRHPKR